MELNQDFQEFLKSFVRHDVRFLIIGGYALAAHGHPRYTKDLDVWVWPDPANVERILASLEDFGFGSLGLANSDFLEPGVIVQLGREPQRIDLLTFPRALNSVRLLRIARLFRSVTLKSLSSRLTTCEQTSPLPVASEILPTSLIYRHQTRSPQAVTRATNSAISVTPSTASGNAG